MPAANETKNATKIFRVRCGPIGVVGVTAFAEIWMLFGASLAMASSCSFCRCV